MEALHPDATKQKKPHTGCCRGHRRSSEAAPGAIPKIDAFRCVRRDGANVLWRKPALPKSWPPANKAASRMKQHSDLDAAVAEAYGWPLTLTTAEMPHLQIQQAKGSGRTSWGNLLATSGLSEHDQSAYQVRLKKQFLQSQKSAFSCTEYFWQSPNYPPLCSCFRCVP